jgi:hypothetical protein
MHLQVVENAQNGRISILFLPAEIYSTKRRCKMNVIRQVDIGNLSYRRGYESGFQLEHQALSVTPHELAVPNVCTASGRGRSGKEIRSERERRNIKRHSK